MKIVFDTDVIANKDIGIAEFLYLLGCHLNVMITKETFKALNDKGLTFITEYYNGEPIKIIPSKEGEILLGDILSDSEQEDVKNDSTERWIALAEKLRAVFPQGKKPGTNLQWKDSTAVIAARLRTLVRRYGVSFTDEDAVTATTEYVASFKGDLRYMQTLRYFIFKNKISDGVTEMTSQLLSYIENAGQKNSNDNEEWTSELR